MVQSEQLRNLLKECIELVETNKINTIDELVEQLTTDLAGLTEVTLKI